MNVYAQNADPTRRNIQLYLLLCASMVITAGCPATSTTNKPPVANAGANQVVSTGATVTLDGSASTDPESDALTFSWKQTLGTSVSLSSATGAIVTFTAPSAGATLEFELTVSDGKNSSTAKVTITVQTADDSAKITEIKQRSITEDQAVTGDLSPDWVVVALGTTPPPADESEFGEFKERNDEHKLQYAPLVKEDLAPGAVRTVELQLTEPSGLSGSVRWIGTDTALPVTISLDGTTLATATDYRLGINRGGTLLLSKTTAGGKASISVTNTSAVKVKVKIVFAASAL